jgi:hypothetical protein
VRMRACGSWYVGRGELICMCVHRACPRCACTGTCACAWSCVCVYVRVCLCVCVHIYARMHLRLQMLTHPPPARNTQMRSKTYFREIHASFELTNHRHEDALWLFIKFLLILWLLADARIVRHILALPYVSPGGRCSTQNPFSTPI